MTKSYDDLPILPWLIAETTANRPYEGIEWSDKVRNSREVERTEALRQRMTVQDIQNFADWVDKRCRLAYKKKVKWFMKCARSKTNYGRDQLYVWISHWLCSWLANPDKARKETYEE